MLCVKRSVIWHDRENLASKTQPIIAGHAKIRLVVGFGALQFDCFPQRGQLWLVCPRSGADGVPEGANRSFYRKRIGWIQRVWRANCDCQGRAGQVEFRLRLWWSPASLAFEANCRLTKHRTGTSVLWADRRGEPDCINSLRKPSLEWVRRNGVTPWQRKHYRKQSLIEHFLLPTGSNRFQRAGWIKFYRQLLWREARRDAWAVQSLR